MSTVTVTARRWAGGWELILGKNDATQVRNPDRAIQQVRDYLDTRDPHIDHSGVEVVVIPEPERRITPEHPRNGPAQEEKPLPFTRKRTRSDPACPDGASSQH
ncbi:hypothetical protein [Brevibacterium salitolerans]|uniref:DUF2188 domain-containing protein n=1 Tax=Brevibacterium salitolerans TaxID=1403566 RepID=A0ABN2WP88_9MICO